MHKRLRPLLRVTFALAVAASAAGCGVPRAANGEGGDATKSDRLDQLLAAVDAKSDETVFKKLLFAPRRDIVLPKALRTLLLRDEAERANLEYGFEARDERLSWFWRSSVNSLRLVGNHRVLRESLISHMKAQGFEPFDSPDSQYRLAFRKQHKGALETALFSGCDPAIGGRVEAVETRFVWRVEATEKSPLPSFREVRSLMPSLEPPSQVAPAPAVVDELLPDLTANYVSASGSHSVLYSLHVLLAPSATNGSKPEVLARRVAEKLQADGFHRIKPRPADPPEWDSFAHSKSAWRATTIQRDRSFLDIHFFVCQGR